MYKKEVSSIWVWWFMPVILATGAAEIRKIKVQGQLKQIVLEILTQKYPIQVVEHLPSKRESSCSTAKKKIQGWPGLYNKTLSQKTKKKTDQRSSHGS
jgi:hypothetical protein